MGLEWMLKPQETMERISDESIDNQQEEAPKEVCPCLFLSDFAWNHNFFFFFFGLKRKVERVVLYELLLVDIFGLLDFWSHFLVI